MIEVGSGGPADRSDEILRRLLQAARDRRCLLQHGRTELAGVLAEHIRRLVDSASDAELRALVTQTMLDTAPASGCPGCGRPTDVATLPGPDPVGTPAGSDGPRRSRSAAGPRRADNLAARIRDVALERAPARAWLHRREPGHLIKVAEYEGGPYLLRIDTFGLPAPRARWRATTSGRLTAGFEPYRPCRWTIECLRQASTVVRHTAHADRDYGAGLGEVDVCDAHAAEHHRWRRDNQGRPEQSWPEEPAPDCMCTDTDQANGTVQDYCPRHGSGEHRGTELDPALLAAGSAGSAVNDLPESRTPSAPTPTGTAHLSAAGSGAGR